MARPLICIVEDDLAIAELLQFNLQNEGYATVAYTSGPALFEALKEEERLVAIFILDLMLPEMDGFEICKRLKEDEQYRLSMMMILTARNMEQDKVHGLQIGADDYLTKPFGMREFLARIQSLLRRHVKMLSLSKDPEHRLHMPDLPARSGPQTASLQRIACMDILIDDVRHRVYKGDEEVEMTHREYELLKFLMLHRGIAYSRDDLLNYVWGYEYSGETRTVDVHIRQLRRKIESDPSKPVLIETVRGLGYRFVED